MSDTRANWTLLGVIIVQIIMFYSYMGREVVWDYDLNGASLGYVYNAYALFKSLRHGDWGAAKEALFAPPFAPLTYLQAAAMQLLVHPPRLAALSLGFVYYLLAQTATYWFFRRLCRAPAAGLIAVFMLLACARPFASEPWAPNIRDFDAGLVAFSLYILASYAIALTNTFRRPTSAVGMSVLFAFCAWCDASLIGGIFLFFAGLLVCLASFFVLNASEIRRDAWLRLRSVAVTAVGFAALTAPLILAGDQPPVALAAGLSMAAAAGRKIVTGDFGLAFWVGGLGVLGLAAMSRGKKQAMAGGEAEESLESRRDQADFNVYGLCLLIFGAAGFAAYAAAGRAGGPFAGAFLALLLSVGLLWATDQIQAGRPRRDDKTMSPSLRAMLWIAALAAMTTQFAFYGAPGRNWPVRAEMNALGEMFDDIRRHAGETATPNPAISLDFTGKYAADGLLAWNLFVYEKYGELPPPRGQVIGGGTPTTWAQARAQIDASDIVVLAGPDYKGDGSPQNAALAPLRADIRRYVEDNFQFCRSYGLYDQDKRSGFRHGELRSLYVRTRRPEQPEWAIAASSSTAPEFGPETLMKPGGAIWHARWDGQPQWLTFTTPVPVNLHSLSITAQDKQPERAPMDFMLQGSDDGVQWRTLLEVASAGYRKRQTQTWTVNDSRRHRHFRLYVMANGDDSPLLTIQRLALNVAPTRDGNVCR